MREPQLFVVKRQGAWEVRGLSGADLRDTLVKTKPCVLMRFAFAPVILSLH